MQQRNGNRRKKENTIIIQRNKHIDRRKENIKNMERLGNKDGTAIRVTYTLWILPMHISSIDYVNELENNHIAINLGSEQGTQYLK